MPLRLLRALTGLVLLTACSGAEGGGAASSGGESSTPSGECETLGEVREVEGLTCRCAHPSGCGGTARTDEDLMRLEDQQVWTCHPTPPPECDGAWEGVQSNVPCATEGVVCHSHGCCDDVARCVDGAWQLQPGDCPP
ncbi:MAG: hypothetical protein H6719_09710 [Sandaracinaceae bacterium]|nr:hypothetical protein [Sandaracinaceae bacterium]